MIKEASIVPKPQVKVSLDGVSFRVVLDVNSSDTKRGIKVRFHPASTGIDIARLSELANKLALVLQRQFATAGLQIDRDLQVRDPTTIGFIIPLTSLGTYLVQKIIKKASDT
jgi:hypothetical protein